MEVSVFRFQESLFGVQHCSSFLTPYMKLDGTVLDRRVIFKDTIPGIEVFRNIKSQAPNSKEIPNVNIQ